MAQRTTIPDFNLNNPIYAGATVTVYTVDSSGVRTTILATLYEDLTSDETLENPQDLDSEGRFAVPVYVEEPVILVISGLLNAPDHETGVVAANLLGTAVVEAQAAAAQSLAFSELASREAARASKFANLQLPDPLGTTNPIRGGRGKRLREPDRIPIPRRYRRAGNRCTQYLHGWEHLSRSAERHPRASDCGRHHPVTDHGGPEQLQSYRPCERQHAAHFLRCRAHYHRPTGRGPMVASLW